MQIAEKNVIQPGGRKKNVTLQIERKKKNVMQPRRKKNVTLLREKRVAEWQKKEILYNREEEDLFSLLK